MDNATTNNDTSNSTTYYALHGYITKAREYGRTEDWCIGYLMAFYNTGIIDMDEQYRLLILVKTIYHPMPPRT